MADATWGPDLVTIGRQILHSIPSSVGGVCVFVRVALVERGRRVKGVRQQ